MRVKNIELFTKNPQEEYNNFKVGDILCHVHDEKIGVVTQSFSNGYVTTDYNDSPVRNSEYILADNVDIQRLRPNIIPEIEGALYVHVHPMFNSPIHKDKFFIAETEGEVRAIFEMICIAKEYPVTDEKSAGGIGYDFRIDMVI